MMKKIAEEGWKIGRLVNVAGADIQKSFEEYTQEKISFQCRVNFEAAAALCRFAVGNRAKELEIVNISSVSGICPMPYFALYSAAKAGFDLLFGGAERGDEGKGGKGDGGAARRDAHPRRREGTDCGTGRVGKARGKISRIRSRKKPARGSEK